MLIVAGFVQGVDFIKLGYLTPGSPNSGILLDYR